MEQLYLLEILVEKVKFGPNVADVPDRKDVRIGVRFANLVDIDILSEDLTGFLKQDDPFQRSLDLDLGKSLLFSSKAHELMATLNDSPLVLTLKSNAGLCAIGHVSIPWRQDFVDMVDVTRTMTGEIPPASLQEVFELCDGEDASIGQISVLVKLTCYGLAIETQFQIFSRENDSGLPSKKYLFKNINTTTIFQAKTYGEEEEPKPIPVVGPICQLADPKKWFRKDRLKPSDLTAEELNKVLCKNKDCPGAKKFAQFGIGPAATGNGLGTVYGPTEIPISYGLSHTYGNLENYGPYGVYTRPKTLDQPFIPKDPIECSSEVCGCCPDPDQVPSQKQGKPETADKACLCCDPLRLKGGAPVEEDNKPPEPMALCKDLMQSYDKVLDAYKKALGPCGKGVCPFSHNMVEDSCKKTCHVPCLIENEGESSNVAPVNLPEPDPNALSACGTPNCPFMRRQTLPSDKCFQKQQMKSACGSPTCPFTKKRLGTATDEDMLELQLMDGPCIALPCGSPSCPFPKPVLPPLQPIHWDCPDPLPKGPCRNPQCPLKPPELRYNIVPKGPCGSTSCPYATPPFCGDSNCPFGPPQPCPYAEPPAGSEPDTCGPPESCGDPKCLYSQPETCGDPRCPATPKPCKGPCAPPKCPPPSYCGGARCSSKPGCPPPSGCGGPSCPFAPPACPPPSGCGGPTCPFASPGCPPPGCPLPGCCPPGCPPLGCPRPGCPPPCAFCCQNPGCPSNPQTCGDPTCSLNPTPRPCPGRLTCPFALPPCPSPPCPFDPCGGPTCPFGESEPQQSTVICGNSECPYDSKKKSSATSPPSGSVCDNPVCPFTKSKSQRSDDVCQNPECPFASKKESPCIISQGDGGSTCPPLCPFVKKESPCFVLPQDSVCSNPFCPFAPPPPPPCALPPCYPRTCTYPPPCYPPPCSPPPCGSPCPPPPCSQNVVYAKSNVLPCKLEVGGAKITVEYGGNDGGADDFPTCDDLDPAADLTPCSPATCKAMGGDLECMRCAGDGRGSSFQIPCPCGGTISVPTSPTTAIASTPPPPPPPSNYKEEEVMEKIVGKTVREPSISTPVLSVKPDTVLTVATASEKVIPPIMRSAAGSNGRKKRRNSKKHKRSSKFVYKMGDLYPGRNIGHRECIIPGRNVPAKMGWLWNVHVPCVGLHPRLGWRPGAVGRTIAKRIFQHRKAKGLKLLEPLTPKTSKKKLKAKYSEYESDSDITVAPKPTLTIKKKEGTYLITMNPLKDPKTLEDNENPYMDCTPLQFKITKKQDNDKAKEDEMRTCFCDEEEDMNKSTDSELDIEFTPPAGVIRPEKFKKKKTLVHTDTQYCTADFYVKPPEKKSEGGKEKKGGKGGGKKRKGKK